MFIFTFGDVDLIEKENKRWNHLYSHPSSHASPIIPSPPASQQVLKSPNRCDRLNPGLINHAWYIKKAAHTFGQIPFPDSDSSPSHQVKVSQREMQCPSIPGWNSVGTWFSLVFPIHASALFLFSLTSLLLSWFSFLTHLNNLMSSCPHSLLLPMHISSIPNPGTRPGFRTSSPGLEWESLAFCLFLLLQWMNRLTWPVIKTLSSQDQPPWWWINLIVKPPTDGKVQSLSQNHNPLCHLGVKNVTWQPNKPHNE